METGVGQKHLDDFMDDVKASSPRKVVQKHCIAGSSKTLRDDLYLGLREEVAKHCDCHMNEVIMVGSGKLGFSIKPERRYLKFDEGKLSDYDMAIISSSLFDHFWRLAFKHTEDYGIWKRKVENDYFQYMLRGWMRPDLLPTSNFRARRIWFAFFGQLAKNPAFGRRTINGGIYKSWEHLEAYQMICVSQCKAEIVRK